MKNTLRKTKIFLVMQYPTKKLQRIYNIFIHYHRYWEPRSIIICERIEPYTWVVIFAFICFSAKSRKVTVILLTEIIQFSINWLHLKFHGYVLRFYERLFRVFWPNKKKFVHLKEARVTSSRITSSYNCSTVEIFENCFINKL